MSWQEFVVELVQALAWPVVIVLIAWRLKLVPFIKKLLEREDLGNVSAKLAGMEVALGFTQAAAAQTADSAAYVVAHANVFIPDDATEAEKLALMQWSTQTRLLLGICLQVSGTLRRMKQAYLDASSEPDDDTSFVLQMSDDAMLLLEKDLIQPEVAHKIQNLRHLMDRLMNDEEPLKDGEVLFVAMEALDMTIPLDAQVSKRIHDNAVRAIQELRKN